MHCGAEVTESSTNKQHHLSVVCRISGNLAVSGCGGSVASTSVQSGTPSRRRKVSSKPVTDALEHESSISDQGGIEAVVCRISGNLAVAGCGGSGATNVRTRATTSTSVQSGTPSRRRRASNKPGTDALEHAVTSGRKRTTSTPRRAGARDAKRMCLGDGVAPVTLEDDNADISSPALTLEPVPPANAEPNTAAAPMTESRDAVATPPFDHGKTDLSAAVPPRETVSKDSTTLVSSVARAADDTGLSPAGTCTSRSSSSLVFDNLRELLLRVVICCGYARFVRVLTGF
jgi:hypothetical protein